MEAGGAGWSNTWEFALIPTGGNNTTDNAEKEGYKGQQDVYTLDFGSWGGVCVGVLYCLSSLCKWNQGQC